MEQNGKTEETVWQISYGGINDWIRLASAPYEAHMVIAIIIVFSMKLTLYTSFLHD